MKMEFVMDTLTAMQKLFKKAVRTQHSILYPGDSQHMLINLSPKDPSPLFHLLDTRKLFAQVSRGVST